MVLSGADTVAEMATFVFKTSVQKPFEQFMKGLEYLSGVVDKDAHAESYQDIKSELPL